jgi:uncharacterized protein
LVVEGVRETDSVIKTYKKALAQTQNDHYLALFLTLRCNFACPYCFQDEQKADISPKTIQQSLKHFFNKVEAAPAKKAKIAFWGGEPLLCLDELEYTVKSARELFANARTELEFHLVTNGSIFNSKIEKLFAREKDLANVQITLDGPEKMHDRRRFFKSGTGSYQKILINLKKWSMLAKKVMVRVNIDNQNRRYIPELFKDLEKYDLDKNKIALSLASVSDGWGRGKNREEILSCADYRGVENELYALANKMGFNASRGKFPKYRPILCTACGAFPNWIQPDGEIHCCSKAVGNKELSLGNINTEINNGQIDFWLKYQLIKNDQCLKCRHIFFCAGICPTDIMTGTKTHKFCADGFKYYLEKRLEEIAMEADKID